MADPPRNLDFAVDAAPDVPDGWVLGETPRAREFAGFGADASASVEDPQMATWTALGGTALTTGPPYDPAANAVLGNALNFEEDLALSAHGVVSPTTRVLLPGRSYTFGAYVRSSDAAFVGPGVAFCADCLLVAVYSFGDGAVTHAGFAADAVHADPAIVSGVSARLSNVNGPNNWVRVAVTFTLAGDADTRGLEPSCIFGLFTYGDADGTTEYVGTGLSADAWGFFLYEGALLPVEGYQLGWTGAGYLFALATPTPATFPSALPQGTTYEGYDRWAFPYLADLEGYLTDASFGAGVVETYAAGWGTDNYAATNASVTYATFGGAATTETYADGWGTDNYAGTVATPTGATWSGDLALTAERYSPAYPEVAYTAIPATDKLSAEAHGLVNGVRVRLANAGYPAGAAFPAPLSPHVSYYVVNATTDDFKLSTTFGGAAVDITDEGTGEQFVVPDPRRYWTLET